MANSPMTENGIDQFNRDLEANVQKLERLSKAADKASSSINKLEASYNRLAGLAQEPVDLRVKGPSNRGGSSNKGSGSKGSKNNPYITISQLSSTANSAAKPVSELAGTVTKLGLATGGTIAAIALLSKVTMDAQKNSASYARSLTIMNSELSKVDKQSIETANQINKLNNRISNAVQRLGEMLAPVLNLVLDVADEVTKGLPDSERKDKIANVISGISSSAHQTGMTKGFTNYLGQNTYNIALALSSKYGEQASEIAEKLAAAWQTGSDAAKDYGVVVNDYVLTGYMQQAHGIDIANVEITDAMKEYYRYLLMVDQTSGKVSDDMIKEWAQLGFMIDKTKGKLFSFDEVIQLAAVDPTIPGFGDEEAGIFNESQIPDEEKNPAAAIINGPLIDNIQKLDEDIQKLDEDINNLTDEELAEFQAILDDHIDALAATEGQIADTISNTASKAFEDLDAITDQELAEYQAMFDAGSKNISNSGITAAGMIGTAGMQAANMIANAMAQGAAQVAYAVNSATVQGINAQNTNATRNINNENNAGTRNVNSENNAGTRNVNSENTTGQSWLNRISQAAQNAINNISSRMNTMIGSGRTNAMTGSGGLNNYVVNHMTNSSILGNTGLGLHNNMITNTVGGAVNGAKDGGLVGGAKGAVAGAVNGAKANATAMISNPLDLIGETADLVTSLKDEYGVYRWDQFLPALGNMAKSSIKNPINALYTGYIEGFNQAKQNGSNGFISAISGVGGGLANGVGYAALETVGDLINIGQLAYDDYYVLTGRIPRTDSAFDKLDDVTNQYLSGMINRDAFADLGWGFADGGIGTHEVHNATLFENNKKEAVIPLESDRGIEYLASAMSKAGFNGEGSSGDIVVNLTLSGINLADDDAQWEMVARKIGEMIDIQRARRGELNYGSSF